MKKPIELSIIIVSYNTKALLRDCLESLVAACTQKDTWEVIVVDNASTDGSIAAVKSEKLKVKNLKIIENKENVGFAAANNQAIKQARGQYVLLLNSDTEVPSGSIQHVLDYMRARTDIGVATGKLVLPNGTIDPASHRGFPTPWAAFTYFVGLERLFPKTPFFSQYHQWYKDLTQVHEIDSPSGAFFMIRKEVIDDVGLLDESYFMYAEDIDWAFRIKAKGWKIVFVPHATILHKKKQSGRGSTSRATRMRTHKSFYKTMLQFYDKHMRVSYPWFVTLAVRGIIKMRLVVASLGI